MLFFLNGFMGSGKSHWGKIWAAQYKLGFVDLDGAIEADEGKSVVDIFESKGETYFRDVEADKLREMGALLLQEVEAYAESSACRRKFLLHYFGEEFDAEGCEKKMR